MAGLMSWLKTRPTIPPHISASCVGGRYKTLHVAVVTQNFVKACHGAPLLGVFRRLAGGDGAVYFTDLLRGPFPRIFSDQFVSAPHEGFTQVVFGEDLPDSAGDFEDIFRIHQQRGLREHRSEEHTSELQSLRHLVCRLLLEKT